MTPSINRKRKPQRSHKKIRTLSEETARKQEKLTTLIVGLIVTGGIPITIVLNPFFIAIFGMLAPWYKIPCRKTVMSKMNKCYNDAINLMGNTLTNQKLALTFDLATVLNSTRQFLVVSGHFVDSCAKKLVSLTLGVRQMMDRSDAASIELQLKEILALHKISPGQVIRVATDGGANVKKAVTTMFGEAAQSLCICHLLNLVVEHSFELSPIIKALLKDIKAIVTFFKMSPVAMNMLKKIQKDAGKKCLVLIQAVNTRWNSQLNCIKRYVLLRHEVKTVLTNQCIRRNSKSNAPQPFLEESIPIMKDVISLLQPIDDLTKAFSSNKHSTSSVVLLSLKDTHQKLTSMDMHTNATADFRQKLTNKLGALIQRLEQDLSLSCAQLVDPRIKGNLLSEASKAKAVAEVKELMCRGTSHNEAEVLEPAAYRHEDSPDQGQAASLLSRLRNKHSKTSDEQHVFHQSNDELETFLNSSAIDSERDPIEFWFSEEAAAFPKLKHPALDLLLTPASSVASERIVSCVNFILRDSRSSLTSKNVNCIVVLRSYPKEIWNSLVGMNIDKIGGK